MNGSIASQCDANQNSNSVAELLDVYKIECMLNFKNPSHSCLK